MTIPARIKLPIPDAPAIKENGSFEYNWYRIMVQLFRLTGNSRVTLADGVYFIESSPNHIDAYSTQDDSFIGTVALKNIPGPTPVPINPSSPSGFDFTPATDGALLVFGARVEIGRDGANFQPATLCGGTFPLLVNDTARIIWYSGTPPIAEFFGVA